jgi:hypothetical protein
MESLRFFGDESFGPKQAGWQGCYAVAGYMTSDGVLDRLCDDWNDVLGESPRIRYFRMSECISAIESNQGSRRGEFADMRPQQARCKLKRFLEIVERYGPSLAYVDSIITWDIFENALDETEKGLFQSPYTMCIAGVVGTCLRILSDVSAELPIDFTFDEQRGREDIARLAWNMTTALSAANATQKGTLTFADDKTCTALQYADLLAWEARRQFVQPAEDHGRPRSEYLMMRRSVARWYSHVWNEPELRSRLDRQIQVR